MILQHWQSLLQHQDQPAGRGLDWARFCNNSRSSKETRLTGMSRRLRFCLLRLPSYCPAAKKDKQVESESLERCCVLSGTVWPIMLPRRSLWSSSRTIGTTCIPRFDVAWELTPTHLQQLKSSQQPGGVAVVSPIRPIDTDGLRTESAAPCELPATPPTISKGTMKPSSCIL